MLIYPAANRPEGEHIVTSAIAKPSDVPTPPPPRVHTGRALSVPEMSAILAHSLARVIVIAGDAESGKSTLLATLYEQFQHGPFAGMEFAGSQTLHGFEERIHDSRIASFRSAPTTTRTSRNDGVRFLHLMVKRQDRGDTTTLLISDLAGELIEDLRSSTEACHRFSALRRADCFVAVVDGDALVDSERCHRIVVHARDLVRGVLDADVLPPGASVQLLLTKWDLVAISGREPLATSMWDDLIEQCKRHCGEHGVSFTSVKVAARPRRSGDVPAAFGMAEMVRTWTVGQLERHNLPRTSHSRPVREIDRFGLLDSSREAS